MNHDATAAEYTSRMAKPVSPLELSKELKLPLPRVLKSLASLRSLKLVREVSPGQWQRLEGVQHEHL